MKSRIVLVLALCLFLAVGCQKQVHVVNRYSSNVVLMEEHGPALRVSAGGTGVLLRAIRTDQKFEFELQRGRKLTHRVRDIKKRMGEGKDVYIIDLDPASKDGAGNDCFPAFVTDPVN
jgi:hypothetical protein